MTVGEAFREALPPFDHHHRVVQIRVEVQRVEFGEQVGAGMIEQAVDVDVQEGRRARPPRPMQSGQHEGRRRHRPLDVHRLRDSLGQHGLSRTQRARQHYHVARAQVGAESRTERDGVLRGGQFGGPLDEMAEIADVLAAALDAGEGKTSAAVRANYSTSFPRTAAALGRLFTIDTLRITPDNEGATTFDIAIKLTPR